MVKVTVIVTVLNEQSTLPQLLDALRRQTRRPDEVVIVDGGSVDRTWDILQKFSRSWPRLHVYQLPGSNRSQARNLAISKARFPIIAITDAGCLPNLDWLEHLVRPFYNSRTQVVSGYYTGLAANTFQKSLIPYVLVMPDRLPPVFFPSTRSMALRKSVWTQLGGFNPANNHSEDYEYARYLRSRGIDFVFVPEAVVSWFPRQKLSQAAWMFFRFAVGDMAAGILRPKVKMLAVRYLIFAYLFFLSCEIHILFFPLILLALIYLAWAVRKNYRYVKQFSAVFWLPVLQITSDICVLFGSVVGLLLRMSIPKQA